MVYDFIVTGVTVIITAKLTHLLKCVYDYELGVGVFGNEPLQLFIKSFADLTCRNREVQIVGTLSSEHSILAFLQAAVIIFKGEI